MSSTTSPTETPDRTFDEFLKFLSHLDEQTLVRLVIDPDEPLRGTESHEASVYDIHPVDEDGNELPDDHDDEAKAGTRYVFSSDQLFEGDLPDNYERETVHYRFTVPDTNELSKTNIELEANYNTGQWEDPAWHDAGYLIKAGVLVYYE